MREVEILRQLQGGISENGSTALQSAAQGNAIDKTVSAAAGEAEKAALIA